MLKVSAPDPVQLKLRQEKKIWNKEVSTFINDLINFKKMMNGAPSKFHMERSSIKDPIPADPASILGVLAGDFQEIAQKGNDIISHQLDYSKTRRKSQPKTTTAPASPSAPPAPNLTQQLQVAEADYNLIAEGSNPITRFISTLKGPWFGSGPEARSKKYRVAMLKAAADLNDDFKKFENQIMGSSPESIFSAGKILYKIETQLYYLQDSLVSQKISLNPFHEKKDKEEGKAKEESISMAPQENVSAPVIDNSIIDIAKEAISDFRKSQPNFTDLNPNLERVFAGFVLKFYNTPSNVEKIKIIPLLMKAYQDLLADANMKHGTNAPTLAEVLMPKIASDQLEVIAQGFLTKWLGKIKHQLSPFDKTSALRLDLLNLSKESRKVVDKIMDTLEKDIDSTALENYLDFISKNTVSMRQIMKPLENTIRGNMFDKTFINLLKNKSITEHSFGLEPKQQERLENMIRQKQYRELTNLYSRK